MPFRPKPAPPTPTSLTVLLWPHVQFILLSSFSLVTLVFDSVKCINYIQYKVLMYVDPFAFSVNCLGVSALFFVLSFFSFHYSLEFCRLAAATNPASKFRIPP
jgi:hypothetical protein